MDFRLYPPVGTCYFKSYTLNLSGGSSLFTLNVTFYVYVTNAKPSDPDFTAKGGKVFIVVVYNGTTWGTNVLDVFGLKEGSGLLTCMQQLPVTGSGVKQGNVTLYAINYSQLMSMYSNGGNTPYNFPAQFQKTFSLTGYLQSADQSTDQSWGWGLFVENTNRSPPALNGLQIFVANSLAVVSCVLTVIGLSPNYSFQYTYDLDFSAETMEKAVVGIPGEMVRTDGSFTKVT